MNRTEQIAVVAMAGRFPGAPDLDTFWDNLVNGRDAAGPVPRGRWIAGPETMVSPDPEPDRAYSDRACLIRDFSFDPYGYDLDADLLAGLDPTHQLALDTAQKAYRACQTAPLSPHRVSTILAAIALPTEGSSRLTRQLMGEAGKASLEGGRKDNRIQALASRVTGLPAALVARALGLGGGSFTLDAACASSLYAVKLACDELRAGRVDAVITGGVSRPDCLFTQVGFSQLRALSPTGRCAPFDAASDGLVVGEGAGILILKRLEDALAHGDAILGLIRGIGLSNDMRGNLLAPDTEGQLRAMTAAYSRAAWRPDAVDLMECHGTGTPVGDATELKSMVALWQGLDWTRGQCAIGSVKSAIGHLLTAAGAASMIKTLLAMNRGILAPSLNFNAPGPDSPLPQSPFRVQTSPQPWPRRHDGAPRRAAVSAFGFGGINAHLLVEQWQEDDHERNGQGPALVEAKEPACSAAVETREAEDKPPAVAVVGMAARFGPFEDLKAFKEAFFLGRPGTGPAPDQRWRYADDRLAAVLGRPLPRGAYLDEVRIRLGEMRIPPKEIPDILIQHLLMLQVASQALADAGLPIRQNRPDTGVVVGMEFDMEAADFHLRWDLAGRRMDLDPLEAAKRQDRLGPPLTAPRTLGALGGIIASRMAREFGLGGPCFTVSNEAASGPRALEVGLRSLQLNETDTMLVCSVDLPGDLRRLVQTGAAAPVSRSGRMGSFDRRADGLLPGEGAAALVLKPLDRALSDGDRIYAKVGGLGSSCGGGIDTGRPTESAYLRSLDKALDQAGAAPREIGLFCLHGSAVPEQDRLEITALNSLFDRGQDTEGPTCAIGATAPVMGHAGAAAGLASCIGACLSLYHRTLPPLAGFEAMAPELPPHPALHVPIRPQAWLQNRADGPRKACAAALAADGSCIHLVLEQAPEPKTEKSAPCRAALRADEAGLLVVTGQDSQDLTRGLETLARHVEKTAAEHMPAMLLSRSWYEKQKPDPNHPLALALVFKEAGQIPGQLAAAQKAVTDNQVPPPGTDLFFTPTPLGKNAPVALVFPGSGNPPTQSGHDLLLAWPEVLKGMARSTSHLKTLFAPELTVPWRQGWDGLWQGAARAAQDRAPLNMFMAQTAQGIFAARMLKGLAVAPEAALGYSLGEATALFALGAWKDWDEMIQRLGQSDLFTTVLTGPCLGARAAWGIGEADAFEWCAAAVNRPADQVREALEDAPRARLLIINTPGQCVIGGDRPELTRLIDQHRWEAIILNQVAAVHCDAARPAEKAYEDLHRLAVTPPPGIRFYSCALGRPHDLTPEAVARALARQLTAPFDFTALVRRAWDDGIRVFLETGPRAGCTAMIHDILGDRPHLAGSVDSVQGKGVYGLFRLLGRLISHRIPVDLDPILERPAADTAAIREPETLLVRRTGGPALPKPDKTAPAAPPPGPEKSENHLAAPTAAPKEPLRPTAETRAPSPFSAAAADFEKSSAATARAHEKFLDFSQNMFRDYAEAFDLQTRLLARMDGAGAPTVATVDVPAPQDAALSRRPLFDRDLCMEFAIGSVGKMLGPEFAVVDTFSTRVRLPDEPLMLVDRIMALEGEPLSMTSGRVVTEHDVLPGAWYLDGDRAPVCVSVEAGQADLFLCAYLGIDHQVRGERSYRLLDAKVRFHRGLPRPGETIRYDIRIEKFVRQNQTWLFFFSFQGEINGRPLITMTDGCAGFFTPEEVENSGGIILTPEERAPARGDAPPAWRPPVPMEKTSLNEAALEALRDGDAKGCFGPRFQSIVLPAAQRLPGGRMRLIDRVTQLDPVGGRYGLGSVCAEADIHPDDWFLTCHFMDDMVMPGTLMYECCAHTLRVFFQRQGWISENPEAGFEPVPGVGAVLKCRGPVTPETKKVVYSVEIKAVGYGPEPFVRADALMAADGRPIVRFQDMSLRLTHTNREEIEAFWRRRAAVPETASAVPSRTLYDAQQILAFSIGNPSEAFGEKYRIFDRDRRIARLPGPPYLFMDRIVAAEPPPWKLEPGGWIEAEYDVPPDAWYFKADRSGHMPFCVLLEIALQPCGWLAAYLGSALRSEKDLKFRNLGGTATVTFPVGPDTGTLTMRSRLTRVAEAGDMIIEDFDFEVLSQGRMVYQGTTNFGFFSQAALDQQKGIRSADQRAWHPQPHAIPNRQWDLAATAPLTPEDATQADHRPLTLPARALSMIDAVDGYLPDGGPNGLGWIRGIKAVDPGEWFFKAHFYQDPVCPGSLGIESMIQLVKFMALEKWPHLENSHRFDPIMGREHQWIYRGQVIPANQQVTVTAVATEAVGGDAPMLLADGWLQVDGLYIYEMKGLGVRLVATDTVL